MRKFYSVNQCGLVLLLSFALIIQIMATSLRSQPSSAHLSRIGLTNNHQLSHQIFKLPDNYDLIVPPKIFNHMSGAHQELPFGSPVPEQDDLLRMKKAAFNMNVGKALDTLRQELPLVFITSRGDLDFSIFANQVTLIDGNQHIGHGKKIELSKAMYITAVKSLRMAAAFSSIYPSVNVRKIEYDEEITSIKCLVNVILPDSVKVDGQSVWEGMFYFGLDDEGLIKTHIFDRKIETLKPAPVNVKSYPWLRTAGPSWTPELVGVGRRGGSLF